MHSKVKRKPPLWLSLVPFVSLILIMLPSVIILGADPQIPLIICIGITAFIGIFVLGYSWSDIENAMIESNAAAMQANFIIMLVGCLMGVWMSGGVVPGLIYYGLKLFTPGIFSAALPILCAVISISTGSAWTTAGTIGVSAMGVAAGLGIPFPIAAGAIITGAQFGDKLSPLSDSTNLAAGITGTNLFTHVRHMLWSTIPSFVLAVGCFAVIGAGYSGSNVDDSQIQMICDVLAGKLPYYTLDSACAAFHYLDYDSACPGNSGHGSRNSDWRYLRLGTGKQSRRYYAANALWF